MANSDVSVCNRALFAVGTRSTIASLTEGSNESNALSLIYESTRDEILSMAMWNFARRQKTLTQIGSAAGGDALAPWAYEYAYPNDCVHARYVMPFVNTAVDSGSIPIFSAPAQTALGNYWNSPPVPFLIGSDDDISGNNINVILTNQYQAEMVYTGRITNMSLWSFSAIQALVSVLASRITIGLTGDKALAKMLLQQANDYIVAARVSDGNEGLTIQDHLPDWLAVRGYAMDFTSPGYFLAPYPPLYPVS